MFVFDLIRLRAFITKFPLSTSNELSEQVIWSVVILSSEEGSLEKRNSSLNETVWNSDAKSSEARVISELSVVVVEIYLLTISIRPPPEDSEE